MDMSATFEAAAEAKMPQAEIVHDRAHVSKHLNETVDKVRRTTSQAPGAREQGEESLKESKFLFLFAPGKLDRPMLVAFAPSTASESESFSSLADSISALLKIPRKIRKNATRLKLPEQPSPELTFPVPFTEPAKFWCVFTPAG